MATSCCCGGASGVKEFIIPSIRLDITSATSQKNADENPATARKEAVANRNRDFEASTVGSALNLDVKKECEKTQEPKANY